MLLCTQLLLLTVLLFGLQALGTMQWTLVLLSVMLVLQAGALVLLLHALSASRAVSLVMSDLQSLGPAACCAGCCTAAA